MSVAERIKLCRIIEKMEGKENLRERLGMKNTSAFSMKNKSGNKTKRCK